MAEIRVTYFNSKGRAEATRMLLKLAKKPFTDRRVEGVKSEEWQKLKPSTPKGQLPILEVDGKMICESMAMARYVAREYNLYGANNWEAAICDQIMDSVSSVFDAMIAYMYRAKTEEEKAEALKKINENVEMLEKLAKNLKKGTFILDKASLADTIIFNLYEMCVLVPDFKWDPYPTLSEISKSFAAIPEIAAWINERPKTEY